MGIVASAVETVRPTPATWQRAMKSAIRSGVDLCRRLKLPAAYESQASRAEQAFGVFAPLSFVAKMRIGDPSDPLLRQVLPLDNELETATGFVADPVGDGAARVAPGLLQKYHGRALLITTGACAIHCRYCFRRHYPYHGEESMVDRWMTAIQHLAADPTIEEIILSGGDPLTATDEVLAELVGHLSELAHLRRLRVHTRLPIVIPERVTNELIRWLRGTRLVPIMVVHANHPREVDRSVGTALETLVDAGIPVLNQAVLLRGVNDDAQTLIELSRRLVERRVMPYYLHQMDRVAGAAHFEVPVARGLELVEQLRAHLPGYAVPRYVHEAAGDVGKRWLHE